MIEVRHKTTRAVLLRIDVETLKGKRLTSAALAQANLSGQDLIYACLSKADLREADLSGALMCNVVLDGAHLERANLAKCDLTTASLLGARLEQANLAGATLRYANLAGADLRGANLEGADLSMSDLRANFREANLVGANLQGSNLSRANLQYANLGDADLTSANLAGAILRGARIKGATMERGLDELTRAVISAPSQVGARMGVGARRPIAESRLEVLGARCPQCGSECRLPNDFKQKHFECQVCKQMLRVNERGQVLLDGVRLATPAAAIGAGDVLDRWKNCLRVRFVGTEGFEHPLLTPGAEGVVVEFFTRAGDNFWQVQFPSVGTINVPRPALQVLDAAFLRDSQQKESSQFEALLKTVKEAVVYWTNKGKFKSLVVWHRDGKHDSFEQWGEADRLIRLFQQRRIPVTEDRWFD